MKQHITLVCLIVLCTSTACAGAQQDTSAAPEILPVLKSFPLEVGLTRVYSVTQEYIEFAADEIRMASYSTVISETIIAENQLRANSLVFTATVQGWPLPFGCEPKKEYRVVGNSIFTGRREIFRWPLEVGQEWDAFGEPIEASKGWYVWRVTEREDVVTPARNFTDCFRLELWTNPDHTLVWFCQGVGIVAREYHHHGTVDNQYWVLQSIQRP